METRAVRNKLKIMTPPIIVLTAFRRIHNLRIQSPSIHGPLAEYVAWLPRAVATTKLKMEPEAQYGDVDPQVSLNSHTFPTGIVIGNVVHRYDFVVSRGSAEVPAAVPLT